ncbi:MAG TPA: hypothetical protein VFJ82_23075 [Longimicrobium sp.]|nr:hypothetical protein [Longimicrobium sp.]
MRAEAALPGVAGGWPPALVRRAAVAILGAVSLAACTGYRARRAPEPSANTLVARRARVASADGASVRLINAIVRGDTLHGTLGRPGGAPVAIALADVRRFEVRQPRHAATTALVLLGTAFVTAFGLVIAFDVHDT